MKPQNPNSDWGLAVKPKPAEAERSRPDRRRHTSSFWLLALVTAGCLIGCPRSFGLFVESDGLVVMEAEHFATNSPGSGHAWILTNNLIGVTSMYAAPNNGTNLNSVTNSPQLTYSAVLTNSGTFKFWVRGLGASGSDDSIFAGVDAGPVQILNFNTHNAWVWSSVSVTITNTGVHQVNLWMREDGAYVDRIFLSASATYTPTNAGPAETIFGVQISSPTQNSSRVAFTTVPVNATVSAPPGPIAMVNFYVNGAPAATVTNPPYSFAWVSDVGHYTLTASATDYLGNSVTSTPVSVTITSPPPATVTYASSSGTIYVSGGGVATLTTIKSSAPNAPLSLVDPVNKVWFLGAKIVVRDGSVLQLHGGTVPGGNANELRLKSDNSNGTNNYVWLDADWGTLDLRGVKVVSWDEAVNAPDTEYATHQRAFIRARSRLVGTNVQQSTLNAINSEIGWLGFDDSESYGLTWEAVGSVTNLNVFGTVSGSLIHDCQLGADTWDDDTVSWTGNEIATNTIYGFDAGSEQATVVANNNVHDNFYHPVYRWAGVSQRLYVTGQGEATLSAIKAAVPNSPLCLVDPTNHVWFMGANLQVSAGATLLLHGTDIGGDVNELRLKSDNSSADGSSAMVDADWGSLDLQNVKVISWDQLTAAPDNEFAKFGRACIRASSRLVGTNAQQSTLNVINSEIGWLGVNASDNYALTWRLVGSAPGVTVFGTVSNCYIHDCQMSVADWFGDPKVYGSTVSWSGNTIVTNTLFGFDATDPAQKAVLIGNNVFNNSFTPLFRWASSDGRIYVTGQGEATLSDIADAVPNAPLSVIDPTNKVWRLDADLYVVNGTRLKLYGPAIGGDVAELHLKSNGTNAGDYVQVRADWGWLDIRNTKITSWDDAANGPRVTTNMFTQPRAFIHARSTLDPDGHTAHDSRMDVINSDIGYLGHHVTEAYGLTWKVVDTSAQYIPAGSTNSLYDLVKVYGDIKNSRLHNNAFGMYCYGAYGCVWTNNEVDHNLAYGFDPHNASDYLDIENNNVHDNGWHGIIASVICNNGILRNNRSYNNGQDLSQGRGNGIMLHRSGGWLIENNLTYSNRDSGIALFASNGNFVSNNICTGNGFTGIRLSVGARNNVVVTNQFIATGGNGILLFTGTNDVYSPYENQTVHTGQYYINVGTNRFVADEPNVRCQFNTFSNNIVNGSGLISSNLSNIFQSGLTTSNRTAEAIKCVDGDSNLFTANLVIETNQIGKISAATFFRTNIMFRFLGTNNLMISNTLPAYGTAKLIADTTNSYVITHTTTNNIRYYHTNVNVHVLGTTTTTFTGQPRVPVEVETNCTARFTDKGGAIFAFTNTIASQTNFTAAVLTNTVTSTGSVAPVTYALVRSGTNNTVYARNFSALPSSGTAQLVVTTWTQASPYNKAWTIKGSSSSMNIAYRVGDLRASTAYVVRGGSLKNNVTFTSDSHGVISFTSNPGTTSTTTYTVTTR